MNVTISALTAAEAQALLPQFVDLLEDALDSGAALGFMAPLPAGQARQYWQGVIAEVQAGPRVLFAALDADTRELLGSVQLDPATKANGLHRAEVVKMMVHRQARRQGLGRRLLLALEAEAARLGRHTLILDTRQGDVAEPLYQGVGYQMAGVIPEFARSSSGELHATVLYYKLLPA